MSKVTLDSFSDVLKAYLENLGLTEEQVTALIQAEIDKLTSDDITMSESSEISGSLTSALAGTWSWLEGTETWVEDLEKNIGNLTQLQTTNKTTIIGAINELATATPDIPDISFDTFSSIDKDTEACSSAGTLATDLLASKGQAYSLTTTTTSRNIFTARFSDVKFGKYALCIRARVSANTSTSAILTMNMLNGSTNLFSKNITGTNFDSNTKYCYICTTFDYEGSSSTAKQPLTFSLYSTTVSGITVYFDYAYITLITPAIYI